MSRPVLVRREWPISPNSAIRLTEPNVAILTDHRGGKVQPPACWLPEDGVGANDGKGLVAGASRLGYKAANRLSRAEVAVYTCCLPPTKERRLLSHHDEGSSIKTTRYKLLEKGDVAASFKHLLWILAIPGILQFQRELSSLIGCNDSDIDLLL